ncbi:MAG: YgaP family membrane protein [Oscillospiraceae bacterium]|jgi:hypothetical protein
MVTAKGRMSSDHEIEIETLKRIFNQDKKFSQAIQELGREWNIERVLEANAACFILFGILLGIKGSSKWLALSAVVSVFLLYHTLFGWCPPLSFFRRIGVRTAEEIDREKMVYKILRGDFHHVDVHDRLSVYAAVKKN